MPVIPNHLKSMSPSANQAIDTPPRAPSPVHGFGTLAVHAGSPHDPVTGAVIESVSHCKGRGSQHGTLLILQDIAFHYIRPNKRWEASWRI